MRCVGYKLKSGPINTDPVNSFVVSFRIRIDNTDYNNCTGTVLGDFFYYIRKKTYKNYLTVQTNVNKWSLLVLYDRVRYNVQYVRQDKLGPLDKIPKTYTFFTDCIYC